MAGSLRLEEGDVAARIGALLGREVVGVGGALAGWDARVGLDQPQPVVEADGGGVGAGHLGVLITSHLGLAPQRQVVARGGCGQQVGAFHGLEVLVRQALGGAVATHPGLVLAPVAGVGAGHLQVLQVLAGEAVIADVAHAALAARLVAGVAGAGGIDLEATRLGVLEEGAVDPRLERVGVLDHRLGAIRDQGAEHSAVELPGRLAGLDGARRGLRKAGVDEAVARHIGGEDPGA